MRLYRICQLAHLENYEGYGASYRNGGRWNRPGIPVVYFAETAAVAMLEMANYLPSPRLVPSTYRLGVYQVPADARVKRIAPGDLPEGWNGFPHPDWTQRKGTDWLRHGEESFLSVPSAAVPGGLGWVWLTSPARLEGIGIRLIDKFEDLYDQRAFAGS